MSPARTGGPPALVDAVAVALEETAEDLEQLELAVRDAPGRDPVRVVEHLLQVVGDARDDVAHARAVLTGSSPVGPGLREAVALVDTAWARVVGDLGDWALVLDLAALARERGEEWPAWLGAVDETRRRSAGSLAACAATARAAWGLAASRHAGAAGDGTDGSAARDGRGGGAGQR